MAKESWYINESELDDFQVQIINKPSDKSFIVQGCAGSGKTILALWKAKEVMESNRGSYYVIVFTKALRQFIEDGVKSVGLNTNRVLYHWQWTKKPVKNVDYIIVDESQDFTKNQILELKKHANKAVLFYGDSAQQLYKMLRDEPTITIEEMSIATGLQIYQLAYNHRLPRKIARIAEYVTLSDDELTERCRKEGSSKPKIYEYDSSSEQYKAIIDIIKKRDLTDVGILFSSNQEVKDAYDFFRENNLRVEAKYDLGHGSESRMDLDFTTDNPKLITYHSAKGLQFETVFLPGCYKDEERIRNPLYVAITRTYRDLYIMHTGNLSSFFDSVPIDLFETNDENDDEIDIEF